MHAHIGRQPHSSISYFVKFTSTMSRSYESTRGRAHKRHSTRKRGPVQIEGYALCLCTNTPRQHTSAAYTSPLPTQVHTTHTAALPPALVALLVSASTSSLSIAHVPSRHRRWPLLLPSHPPSLPHSGALLALLHACAGSDAPRGCRSCQHACCVARDCASLLLPLQPLLLQPLLPP